MKNLQFRGLLFVTAVLALGLVFAGCGGHGDPTTGRLTVSVSDAVGLTGTDYTVRQGGEDVATDANFFGILPGSAAVWLPAGSYTFRFKVSGDVAWKESTPAAAVSIGNNTALKITKESGTLTYTIE